MKTRLHEPEAYITLEGEDYLRIRQMEAQDRKEYLKPENLEQRKRDMRVIWGEDKETPVEVASEPEEDPKLAQVFLP